MKHLRVLLIEDDAADAYMIREMLRRLRPQVVDLVHAATMTEAIGELAADGIDAVIVDFSLPDSSGLETLTQVYDAAPEKPIIVLTGNDDEEIAIRAMSSHAQDYLVKWSFNEVLLLRSIRYAVERQRGLLELKEARKAAEDASRMKSEFLANVSHEIRTPMNAILGMADLLSETALSDDQSGYLLRLKHAGDHLLSMIDDLLDLGRIEAAGLKLAAIPFDLRKLLDETIGFLSIRAQERGIDLRCLVADDVPCLLVGDPQRLRQVLINLIGNAIKFTEHGFVEVLVESHRKTQDPALWHFSIADSGVGIAADKLELIFGRFAQAEATVGRGLGGSGLGLAIAKPLVEAMQGELVVKSTPGVGSTFSFTARLEPTQEELPVTGEDRGVDDPSRHRRPLRILLADDSSDNRVLMESYFRSTPHQLDIVENGALALHEFLSGHYDLILMDVHMPIVDGLTATRLIRGWERDRGVSTTPIIALTADALPESLARCLAEGYTDHVTKPVKKELLLKVVDRYADRLAQAAEVAADGMAAEKIIVSVDRQIFPIMPRFIRNRRTDVDKILSAMANGDFAAIWTLGHNMKGTSPGYYLDFVGELGAGLVDAAEGRDHEAVGRIATELAAYLGRIEVVCDDDGRTGAP